MTVCEICTSYIDWYNKTNKIFCLKTGASMVLVNKSEDEKYLYKILVKYKENQNKAFSFLIRSHQRFNCYKDIVIVLDGYTNKYMHALNNRADMCYEAMLRCILYDVKNRLLKKEWCDGLSQDVLSAKEEFSNLEKLVEKYIGNFDKYDKKKFIAAIRKVCKYIDGSDYKDISSYLIPEVLQPIKLSITQ